MAKTIRLFDIGERGPLLSNGTSAVTGLVSNSDFWAAPKAETGYRHLRTAYGELPFTLNGPLGLTGSDGTTNTPLWDFFFEPKNPATAIAQMHDTVAAVPGMTLDTRNVTGIMDSVHAANIGGSTAYWRSQTFSEYAFGNGPLRIRFVYSVVYLDNGDEEVLDSSEYVAPGQAAEVQDPDTGLYRAADMTMVGMFLVLAVSADPNDLNYVTFLSGYTPTRPWEPVVPPGETGRGIGIADINAVVDDGGDSTPVTIALTSEWYCRLTGITIKQIS